MLTLITKITQGALVLSISPFLVIDDNISLVGLTFLSSMFQISSTMEWHGLKDVEPLQDAKDKGLAQDSTFSILVIQDHIESIGKANTIKRG